MKAQLNEECITDFTFRRPIWSPLLLIEVIALPGWKGWGRRWRRGCLRGWASCGHDQESRTAVSLEAKFDKGRPLGPLVLPLCCTEDNSMYYFALIFCPKPLGRNHFSKCDSFLSVYLALAFMA
jgi:hypothetical protein